MGDEEGTSDLEKDETLGDELVIGLYEPKVEETGVRELSMGKGED